MNPFGAGPLLLDAAIGTALIARGLEPTRETAASWNLRRPQDVLAVHRAHVAAGAQLVLTNTFGPRAPTRDEAEAALRLARGSGARFVAGSLWAGAEDLASGVDALAGADAIWLETATSLDQARAAVLVSGGRTRLPIVVTLAIFPPPASTGELRRLGAALVGVNCSPWKPGTLAAITAGLDVVKPDGSGLGAEAWAAEVALCAAPLKGGCCGTTAAHLAALRATLR